MNKLRQLARENAEDLPKVSLVDEGVESGTETDTSGAKGIPLNSDRAVSVVVIADLGIMRNGCINEKQPYMKVTC